MEMMDKDEESQWALEVLNSLAHDASCSPGLAPRGAHPMRAEEVAQALGIAFRSFTRSFEDYSRELDDVSHRTSLRRSMASTNRTMTAQSRVSLKTPPSPPAPSTDRSEFESHGLIPACGLRRSSPPVRRSSSAAEDFVRVSSFRCRAAVPGLDLNSIGVKMGASDAHNFEKEDSMAGCAGSLSPQTRHSRNSSKGQSVLEKTSLGPVKMAKPLFRVASEPVKLKTLDAKGRLRPIVRDPVRSKQQVRAKAPLGSSADAHRQTQGPIVLHAHHHLHYHVYTRGACK